MFSIHMAKHGVLLALLFMYANCFTVDMYSGNNHIHFGTSNTTNNTTGTLITADFPKYGINFNQSSANATDLEAALNFIANAYNKYTQNLNSSKIVIDPVQTTRRPRYKHVHNHRIRPNDQQNIKKLMFYEDLARILKETRANSDRNRKQFFFRLNDEASRPSKNFFHSIFGHREEKTKLPRAFNLIKFREHAYGPESTFY